MNYSFWEKYFLESPADVTIIGAGIVGLSTAISLKQKNPGLTVKVIEKGLWNYAASTKNAGFSCFGSVSELLDDIDHLGEDTCLDIVKMRWKGLNILLNRLNHADIEYSNSGGMEYFSKANNFETDRCFEAIHDLNGMLADNLGISKAFQPINNEDLNSFNPQAIFNPYEGTINPVKMMNQLNKIVIGLGVDIISGLEVVNIDVENHTLSTQTGLNIYYKKLIICTNGFTQRIWPELRVLPARNQVLMTEPLKNNPVKYASHFNKGYVYFRSYHDRILIGGGRHLDIAGETTEQFGLTDEIKEYILSILEGIYPGASAKIDTWWSGILGVGPSKYPIVEWMDDDVLAGVRLGGMGVAIGSYLGELLAEKVNVRL